MPKESSHIIFAKKFIAQPNLEPNLQKACRNNLMDYLYGSIAPDLFYFCHESATLRYDTVSDHMHGAFGQANNDYIKSMLKDLKENPSQPNYESKLAFICGILTHVAMDSCFHPLIYHVTGNYYAKNPVQRQGAKLRHWLFETWLDLYHCKHHTHAGKGKIIQQVLANIKTESFHLIDFFVEHLTKTWTFDFDLTTTAKSALNLECEYNTLAHSELKVRIFDFYTKYFAKKDRHILASLHPRKYIPTNLLTENQLLQPVSGEPMPNDINAYWQNTSDRYSELLVDIPQYLTGKISQCDRIKNYSLESGLIETSTDQMKHFNILPFSSLLPKSIQILFNQQASIG